MTLYKDIMPYFGKFTKVYGYIVYCILWSIYKFARPKILQLPILGTQFLNPGSDPDLGTFY